MTDDYTSTDARAALDGRIDAALASNRTRLAGAAGDLDTDPHDRWYGRLLLWCHASVAGATPPPSSVDPAAAAIELLREYTLLRCQQILGGDAGGADDHRTAVLLAGDVRHSAAYEALAGIDRDGLGPCFERLAAVTETVAGGLASCHERSVAPARDRAVLLDDTAGALGRGAAGIGATLAGADPPVCDRVETIGRGLATADAVGRGLAPDADVLAVGRSDGERPRLREHAVRRLGEARRARDALPDDADADRLQPLFDGVAETVRRTGDD